MNLYLAILLRTLAVVFAVWPPAFAAGKFASTGDFFWVTVGVMGFVSSWGLWQLAKRVMPEHDVPFDL